MIKMVTNGQGEWKTNSEGHAVNFKAKYLTYVPNVLHNFLISCILPTTNVCEVTKERAILNYAILQNIKFDIGKIIEEAISSKGEGRMNLGYPFLIFQLFKQADVQCSNHEDLLHLIKAIQVRKMKGVLEHQGNIDSSHEETSEEEKEDKEEAIEPTHQDKRESSTFHDPIEELTIRVDEFWDEH